ncbi:MAG: RusA family crossover junction endodeoxyribonuclease [Bacteroidales bacterium]|nr:RusA family crossover junction endodeoxyribonuclease [Bacteroidales bacterium]
MSVNLNIKLSKNPTTTAQQKGESIGYTFKSGRMVPYIKHYENEDVASLRNEYKYLILKSLKSQGLKIPRYEGPVVMQIIFRFAAKNKKLHGQPKVTKPDLDNIAKLLIDAIADLGIFKTGDQQITTLCLSKEWASEPSVDIQILGGENDISTAED